ncbi:MAG TPA: phytoene/squalene synthase family protein [Acidiphilium sp.]|uniref:phytoene/squalene synthase family protein n=2 Tax=unclassified Acidiphilium TaxID=2617493 RepID=UPI000BDB58BA|nr:phytoene/squalene synthase family protein [Acidiphilium sp.]OYV56426.1 MAG: phytoene synthase [Acidiphilium sp. 20-67-58]HQT59894.1 phytoene/squalene synthase family protein [Acidiphilium sp.]HQU10653.1 phytoene/squalene synthase family protein [Acidiphilium sp.]
MPMRSSDPDIAACTARLRRGSVSFHAASRLLPAEVRAAATALYAFCREADDAVDLAADKQAGVATISARLEAICRGVRLDDPVDRAFAATIARHGIPLALPEALIEGLAWDAAGRRYATLAELRAYAARVAGSVGVMMAMLMGARDEASLAAACDLGLAMQLTNIARDVGEDAAERRLYLPLDWLEEAGLEPERFLARPAFTPALAHVIGRLLDEAERRYAAAGCGIAALPLACRPGIAAARRIYREIGRLLAANGLDSVSTRTRVSGRRKLGLAALSLADAATAGLWAPLAASPPPCPEVRFLIDAAAAAGGETVGAAARVILLIDRLEREERTARMRAAGARGPLVCGAAEPA